VIPLLAASANDDVAIAFIEIGAVAVALALLARLAARLGITAIPLYLLGGLLLGEGGIAPLDISADFIGLVAEIGVLLLLLALGLEYGADELKHGLRTGAVPGAVDAVLGFAPGFAVALLLGWSMAAAVLLGGVSWVSSSGIVSKVLQDLDRLGNRETPTILNLLVIEDLAMAVFLPLAAALATGQDAAATLTTIAIALVVVIVILVVAMRFGGRLSAALEPANDESLLLAVFGLTLLVGGLAQALDVSAAIGAFLVGLALSGTVQHRAATLIGPMRDLFAAVFFLFFSFQIRPGDLVDAAVPGLALAVLGIAGKLVTGSRAAARAGVGPAGRRRAGATLVARGEFSIVIAALGATLVDGADLGAVAATFVLLTAVAGPLLARYADHMGPRRAAKSSVTRPE
jgi:CPA2 family monovalent cation:H+ antiporter-2